LGGMISFYYILDIFVMIICERNLCSIGYVDLTVKISLGSSAHLR
jgi:hypothetical protein